MDSPTAAEDLLSGSKSSVVRILSVDTDETVATSLRAASDAYEVRRCDTATDALDRLDAECIDCIASEYTLPDRNGVEFLRDVRKHWPELPFLLVTDDGDEAIASEAIGAGVTGYIQKQSSEKLHSRVAEAVTARTEQRALLDRMTDAFFAVDSSWEFTYTNERGREVLCDAIGEELSRDQLIGRTLWEELPSAVDTPFHEQYHRAMDQQEVVSFEAHYEPVETWFEVRAFPSPTGLSVYFRDVTDRKARENARIERERVLQQVYQITSDKERAFEEKVDDLLHLGQDVLGTECAALSKIDGDDYVFEIVHDPSGNIEQGDVVPLQTTYCEGAVVDEQTLVLSNAAENQSGLTDRAGFTETDISCYLGTPVWINGEVDGTFCFFDTEPRTDQFTDWDVTFVDLLGNWVSYEQERERREAALTRERNRLEDFTNLVSHDLRNPLTVALGRLDIVRDAYEGDPEHVGALESALERIDALIEDLLVLSRSGQQTVSPEPHAFGQLVAEAWEATGSDAATLTAQDTTATVYGDPVSLPQLLENLLRNAVEHGGDGVAVDVGILPENAGVYVADDGPGIPAAERDQVFESGYTTSETGTGFGLRIVSEVIDAHGWDVRITESEQGGARIEITGMDIEY